MRVVGCLLVVLFALASPVAGRDIFVDNGAGDDTFTGQSPHGMPDLTGPVRTIAKALRLAQAGDRIILARTGEPYREELSLVGSRHSGLLGRPLVIEGNGAILDGSAPVPPEAWEHYRGAVFRFRPSRAGYQQLFIDDRPAIRAAVASSAASPPEMQPLEWCLLGGYVYFCVEPQKLPAGYNLSCAHRQTGITLFHVRGVAILDLIVQGFAIDGISAYNSARDVLISGVTSRGNARSGITVGGASLVELDACLLGNNGQSQLLTLPYGETSVRRSRLLANTAPAWIDQGGRVYLDGKQAEGGLDEDLLP